MKLEGRLPTILLYLPEDEYIQTETLAQKLQLTSRTVRTMVKELKELLPSYGATIEHRRGQGLRLVVTDRLTFQNLLFSKKLTPLPGTARERMEYLVVFLFANHAYVKAEDFCDRLYISRKTLSLSLKDAEQYLQKHHIALIRKPYYGMKISGKEEDFRLCLYDMFGSFQVRWLQAISDHFIEYDTINTCITTVTNACGYHLYEADHSKFVLQIRIMLYRIQCNCTIAAKESTDFFSVPPSDLEVADALASSLEIPFGRSISASERNYLALLLISRKKSLAIRQGDVAPEIYSLTYSMLESIAHTFQIDFRSDQDLNSLLLQHMVSLCARLKHRLKLDNPILNETKETYSFAYAIAAHASTVLAEHFNAIVPEEEIGYLALCFALALKRQGNYFRKRNILLVCASGAGSAKLFEYRFREMFHDYINEITTCDIHSLKTMDLSKIDSVFSTVPIPFALPVPVCQVQYFFDKHNTADVERILRNHPTSGIRKYFDRNLFFTDIKGRDREQILTDICQKIGKVKNLPPDFQEHVLKREQLMQTDLFPLVAIPHPYKPITEDTFVAVAILKKPVLWHIYEVQVIFLLSVSTKKENLEDFYRIATRFMMSESHILKLIRKKDFETLLHIIQEVEQY